MMFFDGYIGAPPTIAVFSLICAKAGLMAALDRAKAATAAISARRLDMGSSSWCALIRGEGPPVRPDWPVMTNGVAAAQRGRDRSQFVVAASYGAARPRFRRTAGVTQS